MPSVSTPQARFMAACSHGAGYDKCPPAKVSREFNQADKGTGIMSNKGYQGHVESFAQGGEVLGRTKDFMKTPDRFRDSKFKKATEDVYGGKGVGSGDSAPPAHGKSLPVVKPRGV